MLYGSAEVLLFAPISIQLEVLLQLEPDDHVLVGRPFNNGGDCMGHSVLIYWPAHTQYFVPSMLLSCSCLTSTEMGLTLLQHLLVIRLDMSSMGKFQVL
jgi:hypothetical protein